MITHNMAMAITTQRDCPLSLKDAKKQARLLKALADPTRLQIVSVLARYEDEVCFKEVVECFDLAQPTISYHMRLLREAGIVDVRKHGLYGYYFLRREALADARSIIWALESEGRYV